ncbi:MAG: serine/threonine-protein kinase, partial [Longimicrobiales bacterium]|nr:serine/threonine-protein kinase [Longimicrobiales bacterium]
LAVMSHPSIARVFDAGVAEDGRPYFAMEYVDGTPLNEFCDRRRMSVRDRVRLFTQVCRAVQHAHQKGVIHRDLKPSNILVTGGDRPVCKVIDFGVAKAVELDEGEWTRLTQAGQALGTPAYMSPEQLEGLTDVDTRSDIYALGTVLYELLTGALPFGEESYGGWAALGSVLVKDPPTPSRRVSGLGDELPVVARERASSPSALRRQLQGDLDWIVGRAMEKERSRRYDSAQALAEDLERYLAQEPVLARPPATGYRLRKFVRRNRVAVGAAIAVVVALLVGTVSATVGFVQASREAETARATSEFLVSLFSEADPARARGDSTTVLEVLDRAAPRLESTLQDEPAVRATLLHTLGTVYRELARFDQAVALLEEARAIREREVGPDDPELAVVLTDLGDALLRLDRSVEAEAALARARTILHEAGNEDNLTAARLFPLLAERRRLEERYDSALALTERALQALEAADEPGRPRAELGGRSPRQEHALTLLYRGILLRDINDFSRAERDMSRAVPLIGETLGEDHPRYGMGLISYGYLYFKQGRYAEAAPRYRRSLAVLERVFGPDHPETAVAVNELARAVCSLGELEEAEALWRRAYHIRSGVFGPQHLATAQASWNLGSILTALDRYTEADTLLDRALTAARASQSDGGEGIGMAHLHRANWAVRQGLTDRAAASLDTALAVYQRVGADRPENVVWAMQLQAGLHRDAGRWERADSLYRAAIDLHARTLGESGPDFAMLLEEYATLEQLRGDSAAAGSLTERARSVSPIRRFRGC